MTAPADEKTLYQPPAEPVLVEVPAFDFAMIDGRGDPNTSPDYEAALGALYAISYPVVIALKKQGRADLKVGTLEGLWWVNEGDPSTWATADRSTWAWTMMIRQPADVPADLLDQVLAKTAKKVGAEVAGRVRFERFEEGLCAQLMHRGPYSAEGPNIERLHAFIASQGLVAHGKHHEIYLSDPRRSAPEKMRTVLRQPVRRAA